MKIYLCQIPASPSSPLAPLLPLPPLQNPWAASGCDSSKFPVRIQYDWTPAPIKM